MILWSQLIFYKSNFVRLRTKEYKNLSHTLNWKVQKCYPSKVLKFRLCRETGQLCILYQNQNLIVFSLPGSCHPYLFKMNHHWIIKGDKRQSFSLFLKPLKFFFFQQSSLITLNEGNNLSLSYIIIVAFLLLSFRSLLGID